LGDSSHNSAAATITGRSLVSRRRRRSRSTASTSTRFHSACATTTGASQGSAANCWPAGRTAASATMRPANEISATTVGGAAATASAAASGRRATSSMRARISAKSALSSSEVKVQRNEMKPMARST
jgi:hypothetical protein